MTKPLLVSAWLLASLVADEVGRVLNELAGWFAIFDWSVLGWSFGASTVFVLVEVIQGRKRKGWHRAAIILICVFLSVSPINAWAAKRFEMDRELISVMIGLFGYPLLIKQFKKVKNAESLDDIKP